MKRIAIMYAVLSTALFAHAWALSAQPTDVYDVDASGKREHVGTVNLPGVESITIQRRAPQPPEPKRAQPEAHEEFLGEMDVAGEIKIRITRTRPAPTPPDPDPPPEGVPSDPERTTYKPVAHFTEPPWQDISSDFVLPVVAFCKGGIASVKFYYQDKVVTVSETMEVTKYGATFDAYCCTLQAADFSEDGAFTVYAEIIPTSATANKRVISIELFADYGGTLPKAVRYVDAINGSDSNDGSTGSPMQNIWKAKTDLHSKGLLDGATIKLRTGEYEIVKSGASIQLSENSRWLTIEPDEGHTPVITGAGPSSTGLRTQRLRYRNLACNGGPFFNASVVHFCNLWMDGLTCTGLGRLNDSQHTPTSTGWQNIYATQCTFDEYFKLRNDVVIGCELGSFGSEAFQNARCVVASSIDFIDPEDTGAHPDVWQIQGINSPTNLLLYKVVTANEVKGQIVFLNEKNLGFCHDVAVVDCTLDCEPGGNLASQINTETEHFYFHDNHVVAQRFLVRGTDKAHKYWDIRNNRFMQVDVESGVMNAVTDETCDWDSNHFDSGTTYGTNATTGAE